MPFDQGGREMRELLGGKGANVAEMTRVLGAERVPTGFTITTEACVQYMRDDRTEPEELAGEVAAALADLEERAGKRLGRRRRPAARLRALGRARVDAGDDGHRPEPRPQRRVGRGARGPHREPALRLGRLPPLRADVRQRVPRHPGRAARARDRRAQGVGRGHRRRRAVRGRPARARRRLQGRSTATRRTRTSRRIRRSSCAWRSARCSTPGSASAPRPTGGSTTSPTTGARPATCSRWCSATRATRRARASRSRATRSPARPSRRATSSSTPRARTSSPACATRPTSRRWNSGCPRRTRR